MKDKIFILVFMAQSIAINIMFYTENKKLFRLLLFFTLGSIIFALLMIEAYITR